MFEFFQVDNIIIEYSEDSFLASVIQNELYSDLAWFEINDLWQQILTDKNTKTRYIVSYYSDSLLPINCYAVNESSTRYFVRKFETEKLDLLDYLVLRFLNKIRVNPEDQPICWIESDTFKQLSFFEIRTIQELSVEKTPSYLVTPIDSYSKLVLLDIEPRNYDFMKDFDDFCLIVKHRIMNPILLEVEPTDVSPE
jgi:hypothetical protein